MTWDEGMLLVLRYVEENRRVCLCAYHSVGRDMLQQLFFQNTRAIMGRFVENLRANIPAREKDTAFITDFYTMALVNVLIQWMLKPEGRTPEDVMAQVDVAAHGDIEAALRRSAEAK